MTGTELHNICAILFHMDPADLVDAGILRPDDTFNGAMDHERFHTNPLALIFKLDSEKLDRLADLITDQLKRDQSHERER